MRSFLVVFVLLCYAHFLRLTVALTRADDFRSLSRGDANVILGAMQGEVYLIRRGVSEGGEINCLLDEHLGNYFKLGQIWEHYPKWPALQLAIAAGKREHLNSAFYLLNHGANITHYQLPSFELEILGNTWKRDVGYAPAMLYALGFGGLRMGSQHAAILQRLHDTLSPEEFDLTVVDTYLNQTGNPPLLHIPVYSRFQEGLHVLIADFSLDVNIQDQFGGISALHIAAYMGDLEMIAQLLSHGADRLLADAYGRIPVHYAILRGYAAVVGMLFVSTTEQNTVLLRQQQLHARDNHGRTALNLAALPPSSKEVLVLLERQYKLHFDAANKPTKKKKNKTDAKMPTFSRRLAIQHLHRRKIFDLDLNDTCGFRGGWAFPSELQVQPCGNNNLESSIIEDISDIDVVSSSLSKGVFKRDYFYTQRPVLFTNGVFENQPVWAFWRTQDFVHRYGNLQLATITSMNDLSSSDAKKSSTTAEKWISEASQADTIPVCENENENETKDKDDSNCTESEAIHVRANMGAQHVKKKLRYIAFTNTASSQIPLIYEDIVPPGMFQLCYDYRVLESEPKSESELGSEDMYASLSPLHAAASPNTNTNPMRLIMSPPGAVFPLHLRGEGGASWDLLLTGQKTWYLLPPISVTDMEVEDLTKRDGNSIFNNKNGETDAAAEALAEKSAHRRAKALDKLRGHANADEFHLEAKRMRDEGLLYMVTQYPGEVIFIPHGWSQLSISHIQADSISFSQEFCSTTHSSTRFLPLSLAIYGGSDSYKLSLTHPPHEYKEFMMKMQNMPVADKSDLPVFDNSMGLG